jgi:hypothetical protein
MTKRLKIIAAEEEKTIHQLIVEAIGHLLAHRAKRSP